MSQVTILCEKEAVNPADSLEGLLTGLGVEVSTVSEFTDVSVDSELVVVLQAEKWGKRSIYTLWRRRSRGSLCSSLILLAELVRLSFLVIRLVMSAYSGVAIQTV
ncbi:hypothetical protein RE628_02750 [Paenibacillus sp. D2_2]|uniref:hypothetical protein n=1 Tax=Paenibacillus sp. D2_2 TaxID=3073092 RepID=UPI002815691E|nr:hypothetical protein [Paenibacillus sp. D2_2]WMT41479.1 hypothetical protein RE628_02750 [Paenibacillus sp. D2_2]